MDKRIEIRDGRNMPIGYIREDDSIAMAFNYKKGYVGQYVKSSNITFDSLGKIFCYGNGTDTLVRQSEN